MSETYIMLQTTNTWQQREEKHPFNWNKTSRTRHKWFERLICDFFLFQPDYLFYRHFLYANLGNPLLPMLLPNSQNSRYQFVMDKNLLMNHMTIIRFS